MVTVIIINALAFSPTKKGLSLCVAELPYEVCHVETYISVSPLGQLYFFDPYRLPVSIEDCDGAICDEPILLLTELN